MIDEYLKPYLEEFTGRYQEKFLRLIAESHDIKGLRWLNALPQIIEEIEADWSIKVGEPFDNLSYHYVAPCVLKNGDEAVIKMGYPEEKPPIYDEASMLRIYNGNGAVEYLRIDGWRTSLLIEKVNPGKHLLDVFPDDAAKAVETAIEVLQKLKRKIPERHYFIKLEDWFAGFEKAKETDFPAAPIEKAGKLYEELSTAEIFLIHGDFHHQNILSATREPFLAIDPKGIAGQFGYEISVFLNNHVWWLANDADIKKKLDFAVAKFGEAFAIEPEDLRKWAYAQSVLSAWWTFEENGDNWKKDLALADVWEV